jgi:chaperone BCS1
MHTVSLDQQQKAKIILDVNAYLQAPTANWYATRGIPYRRGYLLHGPPGSGKTSLSIAFAGLFGLSIYCLLLSELGLSETHLASLFRSLPDRCIVLLEDIDSAGLRRTVSNLSDTKLQLEIGAKVTQGVKAVTVAHNKSLISLAGLLNIIDGAASQEVSGYYYSSHCYSSLIIP